MNHKFTTIIHTTYELLDFFPDTDPLKTKAKEKALSVLDGLVMIEKNHGTSEKIRSQLLTDMAILEQYLKLGKHEGWIGGFNLLILLKEYANLTEEMKEIKTTVVSTSVVQEDTPKLGAGKHPLRSEGFTVRQEKILKILSKREQAQVADLLKEIPDVTKRTLRRDLDDLLKKGRILRVGEWNQASYKIGHNRTI